MIDKKDIDRLLAGRKAIDEIKRPDVDVVNTLNQTTKTTEAVSLTTVKQSLAKLDALRKIESDSIIAAEKQLVELGFKGIADFLEFNKQMCLEETKDRLEITKLSCEGCPTKKCVELYGKQACFYTNTMTLPDYIYNMYLNLRLKSGEKDYADVQICPEGYGYHYKALREPQFDLRWRYNG